VKYMIMAFGDASAMDGRSPEWIERLIDFMIRIDDELTASGELVFEQGLADPSSATTIGWEDGHRTTTARPYVAPADSLAGFWVVDVEREERALDIAARMAEVAEASFEVRACAEAPS